MMSTLLLAENWDTAYISWRRARRWDRLACRLGGSRLDLALARGASPDSSAALSLRAHWLIGMRTRATLASSLLRVVRDAQDSGHPYCRSAVPVCRPGVLRCASLLAELSARLTAPGPVSARGVATVRRLLTDGCSPLYSSLDDGALDRALYAAHNSLAVEET
jgi:hypothetical protein